MTRKRREGHAEIIDTSIDHGIVTANATELDSKRLTVKRLAVYKVTTIPSIFHPEFLRSDNAYPYNLSILSYFHRLLLRTPVSSDFPSSASFSSEENPFEKNIRLASP